MTEKPLSIERIAEKLNVNFYDLHPLLTVREEYLIEQVKQQILEEIKKVENPYNNDIQGGHIKENWLKLYIGFEKCRAVLREIVK